VIARRAGRPAPCASAHCCAMTTKTLRNAMWKLL
jgi:hypothetical protein